MRGRDTATHRNVSKLRADVDGLAELVSGTGDRAGLCEEVRALRTAVSQSRADTKRLEAKTDRQDSKIDLLIAMKATAPEPKRLSVFFTHSRVRAAMFVIGAFGCTLEAINLALSNENGSLVHAIAAACAAFFGFAMKWPTDSTHHEVEQLKQVFPSSPPAER